MQARGRGGLAARLEAFSDKISSKVWYPEQLSTVADVFLSGQHAAVLADSLPFHTYASPFLQTLLLAVSSNEYALSSFCTELRMHPCLPACALACPPGCIIVYSIGTVEAQLG